MPAISADPLGYIDDAQLSSLLHVEQATLRNWRCAGKGPPHVQVHRHRVVYSLTDVQRWLEGRTVGTARHPTLATGSPRRRRA